MCAGNALDCDVTSPVLICNDAIYDILPDEMATIMSRKRAFFCHFAYNFTPEMITEKSGKLPDINCCWETTTRKNKEKIVFYFNNDSSWSYEHDYNAYMSWAHNL